MFNSGDREDQWSSVHLSKTEATFLLKSHDTSLAGKKNLANRSQFQLKHSMRTDVAKDPEIPHADFHLPTHGCYEIFLLHIDYFVVKISINVEQSRNVHRLLFLFCYSNFGKPFFFETTLLSLKTFAKFNDNKNYFYVRK